MTSLNSLLYCPCILGVGFARSDRLHAILYNVLMITNLQVAFGTENVTD